MGKLCVGTAYASITFGFVLAQKRERALNGNPFAKKDLAYSPSRSPAADWAPITLYLRMLPPGHSFILVQKLNRKRRNPVP